MDRANLLNFGIAVVILSLVSIAPLCDANAALGDLDATFGTDGRVTTDFGGIEYAYAIAIDTSGKIVVAGYTFINGYYDFALARYNTDGSLDTTFGTNGKVTTDFNQDDGALSLAIDGSGKIVVAGYTGQTLDFALARYNTDGSLDTTFGTNGKVTTNFGGDDGARALAIDSQGKIVVAGYTFISGNFYYYSALARYDTDGSLDTTFGTNGMVITNIPQDARALAIDTSGKIVVAGQYGYDFAVARYNTDGSLDTTFGTNGMVTTDFGGSEYAYALAIDSQGKIVETGYTSTGGGSEQNFALARYNDDGSLDTTFGTNGMVTTNFGGDEYAYALAIDRGGKIVVAGKTYPSSGKYSDFALARYNTDGSLDTTFGTNGMVTTDFSDFDGALALAIDKARGKIVAAGYASSEYGGNGAEFALARYLAEADTNPPTGSVTINGGAEATKSAAVTLTLTASDDSPGAIRVCIANKATCSTWTAFAETKNWTLTTGNETKTIYVWFKDVGGNVNAAPYSDTIILDTIAPTNGTVTATPGDAQVTLDWTGFTDTGSGIKNYKVVFAKGSAPTSCTDGTMIYSGTDTSYIHTGLTNGTKYRYRVCARDQAGNMSTGATANAKPIPETNPPTGSVTINGGAEATKSAAVTLTLPASDDSPGAIRVCIANKATCSTWTVFAETKSWTLTTGNETKTVYVWFKDVWGNVNAAPYSDTILLDTIPPTNGTVTATPGDAQVTLDWTGFTDTGSGIGSYKVVFSKGSAPASCSLGKQIYNGPETTYTHTGLTNGTVYYYRVCAADNAGNTSTGKTTKAKP